MKRWVAKVNKLVRWLKASEDGQSIIIVAAAMIGVIAFVGIVTDVALVYVQYGHLRRATDAAAVSAAGQMREGRRYSDIRWAAFETIGLHNLEATQDSVDVFVPPYLGGAGHYHSLCSWAGNSANLAWWEENGATYWDDHCDVDPQPFPPPDPGISGGTPLPVCWLEGEDLTMCSDPPRKLVRVEAEAMLNLGFMNILGFHQLPMMSESEGEAATLDVTLLLDRSWSMAWDTCDAAGVGAFADPLGCEAVTDTCNAATPTTDCEPMAQVLDASRRFMDRLQPPFDRAAIVTFDQYADVVVPMTSTLDYVLDVLEGNVTGKDITVFNGEVDCRLAIPGNPIWPCTNTNLGLGIGYANNQFTNWQTRRDDSVWVMIVLSDGGANAALGEVEDTNCGLDPLAGLCCPNNTRDGAGAPPYCRDALSSTRHCSAANIGDCHPGGLPDPADWPAGWSWAPSSYDADDFARDMADFAALRSPFGNFIVIFSIGLGDDVTNYLGGGDPDAGEQTLRYLANVGYNGDFNTAAQDLCDPVAYGVVTGEDCGNYYYAPSAAGLDRIFSEIASRIFTRITQ